MLRAYENGLGDSLTEALTGAAIRAGLADREARATTASRRTATSADRGLAVRARPPDLSGRPSAVNPFHPW